MGLIGTGSFVVLYKTVLFTLAGLIYVIQNNLSGDLTFVSEPGVYIRNPFFSNVTTYKKIVTTCFEDNPISVRFADTYLGSIPVSFRFKLPSDPEQMLKLHNEFRGQENLKDVLLNRNARDVTVITATQYTGEEFFQGKKGVTRMPLLLYFTE